MKPHVVPALITAAVGLGLILSHKPAAAAGTPTTPKPEDVKPPVDPNLKNVPNPQAGAEAIKQAEATLAAAALNPFGAYAEPMFEPGRLTGLAAEVNKAGRPDLSQQLLVLAEAVKARRSGGQLPNIPNIPNLPNLPTGSGTPAGGGAPAGGGSALPAPLAARVALLLDPSVVPTGGQLDKILADLSKAGFAAAPETQAIQRRRQEMGL